jgi:hypothetical protein
MTNIILALLTAAFAGVRKDGLNQLARTLALQATTEDEAKALVGKLTKAQVDDFVKEFRAEVDKEVSDSNKTLETNLKKKFDFVEKKPAEPGGDGSDPKGGDPNDIAAKLDAMNKTMAALQTKLDKYEQGDVAKSRLQSLTDKLNDCKDETFKAKALKDFGRMKFDSDDEFNEYLTDTEKDIATANQNAADSALAGQGKPLFGQTNDKGISTGVAQFIDSQKKDGNVLSGKEV